MAGMHGGARRVARRVGAAVATGALAYSGWTYGGRLSDKIVASSILDSGGEVYDLDQVVKGSLKGRRHMAIREELLGELGSISRRMGVGLDRMKIGVVPAESPASGGTRMLPGSHAFLVLPEGIICDMSLSRVRDKTAIDTLDIHPNEDGRVLSPAQRFAIAHEMAHIGHEDGVVRFLLGAGSSAGVLALTPTLIRRGWTAKASSAAAMWAIVPLFFAFKWACREQERAADVAAARHGYLDGGLSFFEWRLRLQNASPGGATSGSGLGLWRSHPNVLERYRLLRDVEDELVAALKNVEM
eukprot:m.62919 g.62919  ORF g.62919 m.62919 type:complete len:299 (-) comp8121_c1_seq1:55-951(-)